MSTGQITKCIDGGTVRTLKIADSRDGWAVAVEEWVTYRGATRYRVDRIAPFGPTAGRQWWYKVSDHATLDEAREAANAEWLNQMGRGR